MCGFVSDYGFQLFAFDYRSFTICRWNRSNCNPSPNILECNLAVQKQPQVQLSILVTICFAHSLRKRYQLKHYECARSTTFASWSVLSLNVAKLVGFEPRPFDIHFFDLGPLITGFKTMVILSTSDGF